MHIGSTTASVSVGAGCLGTYGARGSKARSSLVRAQSSHEKLRVGVLGATGSAGSELVRLLIKHPRLRITLMTSESEAGESAGSIFPHWNTQDLPDMVAIRDANFSDVDAIFCCLPNGRAQELVKGLPKELKIVDLSADFRLHNIHDYEECYHQLHKAPELQKEAKYGLTEILRQEIQNAQLVAIPGYCSTSVLLPLIPLIKAYLIQLQQGPVIVFSSSAAMGSELEDVDRHVVHQIAISEAAEIEQGLYDSCHCKVNVAFFPESMYLARRMISAIHVKMATGVTTNDLYQQLSTAYEGENFVRLFPKATPSELAGYEGSTYCFMNVRQSQIPGNAVIDAVIGDVVKWACSQALRDLNLMLAYPENLGLQNQPLLS